VDVELLVNSLKSDETRIGEWVNVVGYIQAPLPHLAKHPNHINMYAQVQAIILWSSGPLKLDGYENSLDQHKAYRENMESPV
jgi:hypothetical protein